jgi:hypothetical protein
VDFKVHDVEDYAALMASLRLPDPKMMDVVTPPTFAASVRLAPS